MRGVNCSVFCAGLVFETCRNVLAPDVSDASEAVGANPCRDMVAELLTRVSREFSVAMRELQYTVSN